jgi:tRNA threonylcarbamoyl adenosine modification protein (Sua5/YciO/YrdC/YwlC family)
MHRSLPPAAVPGNLARCAAALAAGELAVIPTDTVYGVAANPRNAAATARLFAAKRRPSALTLPVLVASPADLPGLGASVPPAAAALMDAFWPGPLTLILPLAPGSGLHLGEARDTIAVRQPAHPVALALLGATGPLAVTSANVSGQPAATTLHDAVRRLPAAITSFVDGAPPPGGKPSTIVDCTGGTVRLVRSGALDWSAVAAVAAPASQAVVGAGAGAGATRAEAMAAGCGAGAGAAAGAEAGAAPATQAAPAAGEAGRA